MDAIDLYLWIICAIVVAVGAFAGFVIVVSIIAAVASIAIPFAIIVGLAYVARSIAGD